jgi:hypothetical protein
MYEPEWRRKWREHSHLLNIPWCVDTGAMLPQGGLHPVKATIPNLSKELKEMAKTFRGNTPEELAPFLSADFWAENLHKELKAVVLSRFTTSNGPAYTLNLETPVKVKVDGKEKEAETVSIGNMKGFVKALEDAGVPDAALQQHDMLVIEATGTKDTGQPSPMIMFKIAVTRNEEKQKAQSGW